MLHTLCTNHFHKQRYLNHIFRPVSYTHLDVYKRQVKQISPSRRGTLFQARDAVDFNFHPRNNQRRDDGSTCRRVLRKIFRIDGIHHGEIIAIGEIDSALHDILQISAASLQNDPHILNYQPGLFGS